VNLVAALLAPAATTPDRPALRSAAGSVTHGELAARAGRAHALIAGHAAPGERVAIVAGTEPAFVTAYLGALAAGAVAVPLNPTAPAHELARDLAAVAPALVVASPPFADLARRARSRAGLAAPMLVLDDDASDARSARPPVARAAGDLAVLLFTAGTAGPPRAAMLTHGSLLANLEQMQGHPGLRVRPEDVALGVLPLFHVFGLNVVLDLALIAGGRTGSPSSRPCPRSTRRGSRSPTPPPTRSPGCGCACRARRRSPTTWRTPCATDSAWRCTRATG
jgi:long-chain acyl-CoA synthetase